MQLPGIITVTDQTPQALRRAADVIGTAFLEEQWFATYLSALDNLGATPEHKKTLMRALMYDDLAAHVPYQGVYLLEDGSAAMGAYEYKDIKPHTHAELEKLDSPTFAALLTTQEAQALSDILVDMEPVSDFDWCRHMEHEQNHIYIYGLAVDAAARGTGALKRLLAPLFDYADEHRLNVYLECYTERLQSLYEHIGFDLIDILSCDAVSIKERRMVRPARV